MFNSKIAMVLVEIAIILLSLEKDKIAIFITRITQDVTSLSIHLKNSCRIFYSTDYFGVDM